jgi:hypothetical protein
MSNIILSLPNGEKLTTTKETIFDDICKKCKCIRAQIKLIDTDIMNVTFTIEDICKLNYLGEGDFNDYVELTTGLPFYKVYDNLENKTIIWLNYVEYVYEVLLWNSETKTIKTEIWSNIPYGYNFTKIAKNRCKNIIWNEHIESGNQCYDCENSGHCDIHSRH